MLAILRGVLQQENRHRGHVIGDVADMPLAAVPHWTKVRRFLARIVTFARTQLIEFDVDRSSEAARGGFRQDAHAAGSTARTRWPGTEQRSCR